MTAAPFYVHHGYEELVRDMVSLQVADSKQELPCV